MCNYFLIIQTISFITYLLILRSSERKMTRIDSMNIVYVEHMCCMCFEEMIYLNLSKAYSHIFLAFTSLSLYRDQLVFKQLDSYNCTTRLFCVQIVMVKSRKKLFIDGWFSFRGSIIFAVEYEELYFNNFHFFFNDDFAFYLNETLWLVLF